MAIAGLTVDLVFQLAIGVTQQNLIPTAVITWRVLMIRNVIHAGSVVDYVLCFNFKSWAHLYFCILNKLDDILNKCNFFNESEELCFHHLFAAFISRRETRYSLLNENSCYLCCRYANSYVNVSFFLFKKKHSSSLKHSWLSIQRALKKLAAFQFN